VVWVSRRISESTASRSKIGAPCKHGVGRATLRFKGAVVKIIYNGREPALNNRLKPTLRVGSGGWLWLSIFTHRGALRRAA